MTNIIQQHRSKLSRLVKHLIIRPSVVLFVFIAYTAITNMHAEYTQNRVTAAAKVAWLGKAKEGQIRIYECVDGTSIDRKTIIGNHNPCPGSEVKAISIADAAHQTKQRENKQMGLFYLFSVFISGFATWMDKRMSKTANKSDGQPQHQADIDESTK